MTAVVGAGILALRRLLAGRAMGPPAVQEPAPAITDVSARAAEMRRDGRRLAVQQLLSCAVIVVALVADIGWLWLPLVLVGVLIGVAATARARRRELSRSATSWTLGSGWSVVFGVVGGTLLVVGVSVVVRAIKELVLLPSLTHLRWSERLGTTPAVLTTAMAGVGVACLVLAAVALRRARAHARSTARSARDGRPPILYLRSFEDDALSVPAIHSARRPFFELFGLRARDPFEEGMAWELAAYGPVTAVGRPGRSVATLGATRELLDDATWRSRVAERMDAAGRIIIAIGATEGLHWELGELARRGHLTKSHFVVPPVAPAEQDRRWRTTRDAIDEGAGRVLVAPVVVGGLCSLHIDPVDGSVSATRADKLDEAGYRASVETAFEALAPGRTDVDGSSSMATADGRDV